MVGKLSLLLLIKRKSGRMMRGIFTLVFCLGVSFVFGQTVGDYRSAVNNGSWTTPGSWQTWNGTTWVTATSAPTSANNLITIRNLFNITHNSGSAITIDQTIVDAGATLTIASGSQITVADGAGTNDLNVTGT